jgi:RNA polymerase sigma-70 factor (TIGR02960 family)
MWGTSGPGAAAVLSDGILARARGGDADAFRALTDPHRRELQLHCYRLLGSVQDAEDLLQETLLAAWRTLEQFEGRSSLRAWLHRIATNRCLNALRDRARRPRAVPPAPELPEPTRRPEPLWLSPYPDALLEGVEDRAPGPEARYETREAVGLAFMAALHHLPPRQRAVLVLREVLGFRASEVADMLGSSEAAVKGALQRARAALEARLPAGSREGAPLPGSRAERELVARFAAAIERGDVGGVVALLTDEARFTMPPEPYEYEGPGAIRRFLESRPQFRGTPLRLVPTRANGQPAVGCYLPDARSAIARAYGMLVLTLAGDRVAAVTWFGDRSLFPRFGLPATLREEASPGLPSDGERRAVGEGEVDEGEGA